MFLQYDKFLGLTPVKCCKGCNRPLVCRSWAASAAAADRGQSRRQRAAARTTDLHALLEQTADVQREHAVPHAAAWGVPTAASAPSHHAAAPVHDAHRPVLPAGVAPVPVLHDAPPAVITDAFKLDPASLESSRVITTYYRNSNCWYQFYIKSSTIDCINVCHRFQNSVVDMHTVF